MEELFDIALTSVMAKFPGKFSNPKYRFEIFDLVSLACDELMHKHFWSLIVTPFVKSLGEVEIEDDKLS